jgi:DUF4097 and DUF4098 domain-containing protein YvlB
MTNKRSAPESRKGGASPLDRILFGLVAAATLPILTAGGLRAQDTQDWCRQNWSGRDHGERFCEVREETLAPPAGGLNVDAEPNGSIRVRAAAGGQVRVQARVETHASSLEEARALAKQVEISTEGGRIRARGPHDGHDQWWSVSYRIEAPAATDVSLRAMNGSIDLRGMTGTTRFRTLNGGVDLADMAGDVSGSTTNGGLDIVLAGRRWEGAGLDVRTTNGGVDLTIPEGYSAHLITSTVNGGLDLGFPITVQGRIDRDLTVDLGGGGTTIRAATTNGGVHLHRG